MGDHSTERLLQRLKPTSGKRRVLQRKLRPLAVIFSAACGVLASVASLPVAHADPPPALRVVGRNATCPTTKQVAALLERMLLQTKTTADTGPPGAVEATIFDQGRNFRVTIAGEERSFDDPARECAERARHAAVFIALILDPLMTAELSPEAPVAPPQLPPSIDKARPAQHPPDGFQWEMTLGWLMQVAPGDERRQTALANGIAVFARAKRGFHLALGAGVLHSPLHFDVADADAWWAPIDVAAGFSAKGTAWEVGFEIGPQVSVLWIAGENVKQAQSQARVDVGGRASLWSRFWVSQRFGAFLSAEAVVRPFPYIVDVDPRGGIGQMPVLWLGASAGLAASLL
jgi:hypothetical protein